MRQSFDWLNRSLASFLKIRFVQDTMTLSIGLVASQAITVLVSPLLTRLYTPDQFGVFSVFSTIVATISVVICLSYEAAVVLPEKDEDALTVLGLCLIIASIISGIAIIAVTFWQESFINYFKVKELAGLLWAAPFCVFLVGLYQMFNYWCTRQRQFRQISFSRIGQSLVTGGVQALSSFMGFKSGGLIYGLIAGQFVAPAILICNVVGNKTKQIIRRTDLKNKYLTACLYRYRHFPIYFCFGTFVNTASWQVIPLMLVYYFGSSVAGQYFLSYRLASIPMSFLGSAIGQVIFQRSAIRIAQNEQISDIVENVVGKLIVLSILPFICLSLFAPTVFSAIFGKEWGVAGNYLRIMTPLFFFQFLASPVSMVLIALEKQKVVTMLQSLMLIGALFSLFIGGRFIGRPSACLMVYTLVQSMVYAFYLFIIFRFSSASPRMVIRAAISLH